MSDNKKRLFEFSIEELQLELDERKRQKLSVEPGIMAHENRHGNDNNVDCYGPSIYSLSRQTAYQRLCQLFDSPSLSAETQRHVLFLIRTHPTLLTEAFHGRTTISYFLSLKVELDVMKEICSLYKLGFDSSTCNYDFNRPPNPIEDAVLYGPGGEGVFHYLLQEFPDQVTRRSQVEPFLTPLDFLVNRMIIRFPSPTPMPAPSTDEFLEMCDAMLTFRPTMFQDCNHGRDFLETALWLCASSDVPVPAFDGIVHYLFSKFSEASNVRSLFVIDRLSFGEVSAVSKILPTLKKISLGPSVLGALQHFSATNLLSLEELIVRFFYGPDDTAELLKRTLAFIEGCPKLKKLNLSSGLLHRNDAREYTLLCAEILRKKSSIEDCEMEAISSETAEFGELISAMSNVKSLTLRQRSTTPTALEKWCAKGIRPSLQKLKITLERHSPWTKDCLVHMIHQSSSLVSLKIAVLGDNRDITDIVASTLTCNRMSLFIYDGYCEVDFATVLPLIGKNTVLTELVLTHCRSPVPKANLTKVLVEQNKTLQKFDVENSDQSETVLVDYYLSLNRFGRAKLTGRSASAENLLDSLVRALTDEKLKFDLRLQHSIQYDLLLVAPSIWSDN